MEKRVVTSRQARRIKLYTIRPRGEYMKKNTIIVRPCGELFFTSPRAALGRRIK